MKCFVPLLAALTIAGAAIASPEIHVRVAAEDQQAVSRTVAAAAQRACRIARQADVFGDYGSQAECVENTLESGVRHLTPAGVTVATK